MLKDPSLKETIYPDNYKLADMIRASKKKKKNSHPSCYDFIKSNVKFLKISIS